LPFDDDNVQVLFKKIRCKFIQKNIVFLQDFPMFFFQLEFFRFLIIWINRWLIYSNGC